MKFCVVLLRAVLQLFVILVGVSFLSASAEPRELSSYQRGNGYRPVDHLRLSDAGRAQLGTLLPAEKQLLEAYQNHEAVVCSADEQSPSPCTVVALGPDPITFETHYAGGAIYKIGEPRNSRTIRAALIRWLSTNDAVTKKVAPAGIIVVGARILGTLNLWGAHVPFPLVLINCVLSQPIILEASDLTELNLDGTQISGLFANFVHVHSAVLMRHRFVASGPIWLGEAEVDGSLVLSDHTRIRELVAFLTKIHGALMMDHGFYAAREVFISGAQIDGNVDLTGAEVNPGTDGKVTPIPDRTTSVMANLTKVHGSVLLRNTVTHGYIRLLDATIDGDLVVACSRFYGTLGGLMAPGIVIGHRLSWELMTLRACLKSP